jgi:cytochrome c553
MVKSFRVTTILLASALVLASATYSTAAKKASAMKKKPAASSSAAMISQGKALAAQYRCGGCHGADLKGKPGGAPNIHVTGALHDYTQAQFVTLLDTGKMNNGRQLSGMPVLHMPAAKSKAIFAYLKSLK